MDEGKKKLWVEAIKWPLYSVAIIPIFISAIFTLNTFNSIKLGNFIGFAIASILILFWENLTNDLFDSETGIDEFKFHSILNLITDKRIIQLIAYFSLFIGLMIIYFISLDTSLNILFLVVLSCILGYLYQGPPFRLGYLGLGEPLCWLAFGPLAHSAALLALNPSEYYLSSIPWKDSLLLGTGPSLAITLVLFCSHFHQINEDRKFGKNSPLVLIGAKNGAYLIPWIILVIYGFQLFTIFIGFIPNYCLLYLLSLPSGLKLINLLKASYKKPRNLKNCKYIAIKFQTINGIGLIAGLFIDIWF